MRANVNLDADAYTFATTYASAKGIPLGAAISELLRRAEDAPAPPTSVLTVSRRGFLVRSGTGRVVTLRWSKSCPKMTLSKCPIHLLDVNVVVALLDQLHIHNAIVDEWFDTPGLQWSLCAFTEAGVLRYLTRPKTGKMSMEQTAAILDSLKMEPGYHFQPITADWKDLTEPFARRVHGHNHVTDAYLLGLAIREGLILTTFDKAILHMAGEHKKNVLLLKAR